MKKQQIAIVLILILLGLCALFMSRPKEQEKGKPHENYGETETQEENEEFSKGQESSREEKEENSDIRSWFTEDSKEGDSKEEDSKFPYRVANTPLVIRAVKSYRGVFIEDGSDRDISGVATIIVDNKGKQYVEYAKLLLECGDKELVFEVRTLAPGGTMVVQESNASAYTGKDYGACKAEVAYMDGMEMSDKQVKVWENEKGALQVKNISEKDIACVRVFYKFYIKDLDVFVGGITYTSKIESLKAGEIREITPSHYNAGSSKVMMVRTYDTK